MYKLEKKTLGSSGAVDDGEVTWHLPSGRSTFFAIPRLVSGVCTDAEITNVQVKGTLPGGSPRSLQDISGVTLNTMMQVFNKTDYATNGMLQVPIAGLPNLQGKAINRQFPIAVNANANAKALDHYEDATLTLKITGATAALFELDIFTGPFQKMLFVRRAIEKQVALFAGVADFVDEFKYGRGANRFWESLWLKKSAAAVISDFRIHNDDIAYDHNLNYIEATQLLTDNGLTPGADWQYIWLPSFFGFDDYLDTKDVPGTKNIHVEVTSTVAEQATAVHTTIGGLAL